MKSMKNALQSSLLPGLTLSIAMGLLVACGGAPAAKEAAKKAPAETVISLQEINCQSCGSKSVTKLTAQPGVVFADFDRKAAELTIGYDPKQTNPTSLAAAVGELGYQTVIGAGHGRYTQTVTIPEGVDAKWISKGGVAVETTDHLAPGKVTVVDFSADWCGPCKIVDREMVSILRVDKEVALRKVDVGTWESPVAKRYLKGIPNLPYVVVYGKSGAQVRAISGLDIDALRSAIEEGKTK